MYTQQDKKWFMETMRSFLNVPYIWGGDDPSGLDCSGSVVECLKVIGAMGPKDDATANDLWNHYKNLEVFTPIEGDFVFWFDNTGRATHIAVCVDDRYCITADGGGSFSKTFEDAVANNSFIKIRLISHRKSMPRYIRIFK